MGRGPIFGPGDMAKVLVGLSGGVDSSAAAALMLEQGHEVAGAFMKNWINAEGLPGDCPWERDLEDALAVARALGIEGYRSGVTPNPDVWCNREMKFGVFLDYALDQGFEAVATGHYARRRELSGGQAAVLKGADPNKDQSYFLAMMTQRQVAHARFPVGEMLKPQVREVAGRHGLPTAGKKDSQGICFIGEVKMRDFIRHYIPDSPGDIVDPSGKVLGTHDGLHLYTLGQRKGHGVASPREGMAYVVVAKDLERNRLVLGWDELSTPGLYATRCVVGTVSTINEPFDAPRRLEAMPRYRAKPEPCRVTPRDDGKLELEFDKPQRALALGQICAFYEAGRLLGGGVFEEIG
jgi:tRNA-specific 2-thiouridylase